MLDLEWLQNSSTFLSILIDLQHCQGQDSLNSSANFLIHPTFVYDMILNVTTKMDIGLTFIFYSFLSSQSMTIFFLIIYFSRTCLLPLLPLQSGRFFFLPSLFTTIRSILAWIRTRWLTEYQISEFFFFLSFSFFPFSLSFQDKFWFVLT